MTIAGSFGVVYHLWRFRKDGSITTPVLKQGETRVYDSREVLFLREFVTGALVCAALAALALIFPAPLGPVADPSAIGGEARAPWIFLWVQNLLRVLPSVWAGIAAPSSVLVLIVALPLLDRRGPGRGVWFARERWKPQVLLAVIALALIFLSIREVLQ